MDEIKCPECGENENLHPLYDYGKPTFPFQQVLCNECGNFFVIKTEKDESENI